MSRAGVRVLCLNAGSSTLKTSVVVAGDEEPAEQQTDPWADNTDSTLRTALDRLGTGTDFDAVAHRVVHGGTTYTAATLVDDVVTERLDELIELAPLHNARAVAVIHAARELLPNTPHVACFDTAFHSTLPETAWRYPVPYDWAEKWGIRRLGFHGLSVEWSVRQAAKRLNRSPSDTSVVVAHLGAGSSVTAVRNGRSTWTSMGFTPLEGLMMATRSGSIDPGVLIHLVRAGELTVEQLDQALEEQSGLLGVSGASGDMKELQDASANGDGRARLAIDMFIARAAEGIAAAMTWVEPDALVFTGGIGSNDVRTREEICSRVKSAVPVFTIDAREDVVMADQAARAIA